MRPISRNLNDPDSNELAGIQRRMNHHAVSPSVWTVGDSITGLIQLGSMTNYSISTANSLPPTGQTPACRRRGHFDLKLPNKILDWSGDGRAARSSRMAQETTRQTRQITPLALWHSAQWKTVDCGMVMGKCDRQFVFSYEMAVSLRNQHAVHHATAR